MMMSHVFAATPPMTVDEFLVWPGDGVNRRHALIDGVPAAMSPAAVPHGIISGRLARLIGNHLLASRPGCEVIVEPGIQPRAGAAFNVRIPDLAVACPPLGQRLLENPTLIIEVLSPGNARETREAVRACLTIPSLREVLIVQSVGVGAEILTRQPDREWPEDPVLIGPRDDIVLASLDFRCKLAAVYPD